ncbi:Fe-S oxidoreductase [Pyrodictium occultum]|uniref:Fe-S oxidoreductase n=1 Tax=Pyrodictium occultum TaxID=2309 RepID=A0A0V8RUZ7_PYROC|nr:YkgJ family cysteine cluster protein [Pyrodictium occultum]KSW11794.1 Fe-S oxidoreductase [Pyrodictium occultum]
MDAPGIDELEEYTRRLIPVKPGGAFRFRCTRCGRCCSGGPNVSLTVFDAVRMARFLRISWRGFLRGYVKVIIADIMPHMLLRGDERGRCLFLAERHDGVKLCVIYPARPMRCRLYPLLVEGLRPSLYLDPRSPGVGSGPERRPPSRLIEQYVWERREHYRRLHRLVVEEGMEPLEALYRALDEAWEEAERGARWADLDYLASLGSV